MPRLSRTLRPAILALVLLTFALPSQARRHRRHRRSSLPTVAGLVAARDPVSGALVAPTRDQILELSAREEGMISRSTAGLVQRQLAGGGVALELDGRFQEFLMVHVGPRGAKSYQCLGDAADFHQAAHAAPRALEEK